MDGVSLPPMDPPFFPVRQSVTNRHHNPGVGDWAGPGSEGGASLGGGGGSGDYVGSGPAAWPPIHHLGFPPLPGPATIPEEGGGSSSRGGFEQQLQNQRRRHLDLSGQGTFLLDDEGIENGAGGAKGEGRSPSSFTGTRLAYSLVSLPSASAAVPPSAVAGATGYRPPIDASPSSMAAPGGRGGGGGGVELVTPETVDATAHLWDPSVTGLAPYAAAPLASVPTTSSGGGPPVVGELTSGGGGGARVSTGSASLPVSSQAWEGFPGPGGGNSGGNV